MSNLLSGGPILAVGIIVVVGWAACTKLLRKKTSLPEATPLSPEWHDLVHRNQYGRRRLHDDQQSMLRDFVLISMRGSLNCVRRMCNYLGRRKMPEHLRIAPESIIDMGAYQALRTPNYRNGNILEFVNRRAVSDGRKLQLVSNLHYVEARAHRKPFSSCKSRKGLHTSTASESSTEICTRPTFL